jgi:hypothetical protein
MAVRHPFLNVLNVIWIHKVSPNERGDDTSEKRQWSCIKNKELI